jgi:FAD/FMN-containing dehydrogenase
VAWGHVGDSNLHLWITVQDDSEAARHAVEEMVYAGLQPVGGTVSAEHGIGLEKQPWLPLSRSEAELALMRRLKDALDPKGILNPGRVLHA